MTTKIKSVAREVDIDLNTDLKAPRGFRVFPAVLANSEEIAAAHERLNEVLHRHRAAVSAVRSALSAVVRARNEYESQIAHAALNRTKEPPEPDVMEYFAEARRQMSQVRAMSRAAGEATRLLAEALREHGPAAVEHLRDRAAGYADEAIRHEGSMRQALGNFGALKYAADWLDDWVYSDAHPVLNARAWNGVDAPDASIGQAHKAVGL
jgi:hypothetical protein